MHGRALGHVVELREVEAQVHRALKVVTQLDRVGNNIGQDTENKTGVIMLQSSYVLVPKPNARSLYDRKDVIKLESGEKKVSQGCHWD